MTQASSSRRGAEATTIMTTPGSSKDGSEYPKRRSVARPRPWVPEVPDAFEVPDVPETAVDVGAVEAVAAATSAAKPTGETVAAISSDGTVEVKVDLRGHLCHLRIDPSALRNAHPQRLGAAVVEAMSDARTRADRLDNERRRR
jgi:DNA-binding protein YbaB